MGDFGYFGVLGHRVVHDRHVFNEHLSDATHEIAFVDRRMRNAQLSTDGHKLLHGLCHQVRAQDIRTILNLAHEDLDDSHLTNNSS